MRTFPLLPDIRRLFYNPPMRKLLIFIFLMISVAGISAQQSIVSGIGAEAGSNTKINVFWTLPTDSSVRISSLLVYRSSRPIKSAYELRGLAPIKQLNAKTTEWTDTVNTYGDYYYAVVAEQDGKTTDLILPSINATVNGVHLKIPQKKQNNASALSMRERLYSTEEMRETPLPFLDLTGGFGTRKVSMSVKAKASARNLGDMPQAQSAIRDSHIFEDDLISPDGGDDFLLFEILRTTFIQKNYAEAASELERFLNKNNSPAVENRARFYLGEAYYFMADYQTASKNFIMVYDIFPSAARKWLVSSLDMMQLEEASENIPSGM